MEADLIVHVRDVAHPDSEAQKQDVESVLRGLGVVDSPESAPVIEALNKIDLLAGDAHTALRVAQSDTSTAISAVTGEGVEALRQLISETLQRSARVADYALAANDGAKIAWLHEHGEVIARTHDDTGQIRIQVRLSEEAKARFERMLSRA